MLFLQNHDQIGNRAFGERLTSLADPHALEAAIALQLLAPQIPLLFMGEETASETPFLFFTDHNEDWPTRCAKGAGGSFRVSRRSPIQASSRNCPIRTPSKRWNARRNSVARPDFAARRQRLYAQLLQIRRTEIVPRLDGARAIDACALGAAAVIGQWRMGDGARLALASNLGSVAVRLPPLSGRVLFASSPQAGKAALAGELPAHCTVAVFEPS